MTRDDCDVLIVGAGPVGLSLAIELARRNVTVLIVDTLAAPTEESRAIIVHSRTLDHFEALGVLDEIMAKAIVSTGMEAHADGRSIAAIEFDGINAVHPYSVSLVQSDTEAVLTSRLNDLGTTVERSRSLTSWIITDDHVDATVTDAGGSTSTIRAGYVVGADGARSMVRHLMGQQLSGSFVGDDVLLGDIEAEHDYDRSHFHAFFSPGQTTGLLFPLRGNRLRVFAQLPPGVDHEREVTADWLQQAVDERGMKLRITSSHWLSRFGLKHGQVANYRDGRVFLAGDAAHIHSPAGALGMNTGIQDAINLGWKLATAIDDGNCERLLDSYHSERHPIGAQVVALTTAITSVATVKNPVVQRMRNTLMHFGLHTSAVTDRMADMIEQQRVHYRRSPIVCGHGGSLHPGDFLHLPETVVAKTLATTTGHIAVEIPGSEPSEHESARMPRVAATANDLAALEEQTGLHDGGLVIVRPDGYVGSIAPSTSSGEAYRRGFSATPA